MKGALRAEARAALRALTPAERAEAGAEIQRAVWSVPEVAGARQLLLYAALPSEVPTAAIAEEARRRGIVTIFPRCLPGTQAMTLHRLDADTLLVPGAHGIREPGPGCPLVPLEEIDAALIPGLAWSRDGGRLGRGAGYYDRLLGAPAWRGFICGLFFAAQELPHIPLDPWDVPLDAAVTEREVLRLTNVE